MTGEAVACWVATCFHYKILSGFMGVPDFRLFQDAESGVNSIVLDIKRQMVVIKKRWRFMEGVKILAEKFALND